MRLAGVAFSRSGVEICRRLQAMDGSVTLYLKENMVELPTDRILQHPFSANIAELFREYDGILFVMATGIVVRAIAPYLQNKMKDPAVVVMDDQGHFVISLLSGHWGGANRLARKLAKALGATPVITTATDNHQVPAFDQFAQEYGLAMGKAEQLKYISGALVDGRRVGLFTDLHVPEFLGPQVVELGTVQDFLSVTPSHLLKNRSSIGGMVLLSDRAIPEENMNQWALPFLLLRPKNLVVGIGLRRGKDGHALRRAIYAACAMSGVSPLSIGRIATIDKKADEVGLWELCTEEKIPLQIHSTDAIKAVEEAFPISPRVLQAIGVGSVAEPSAYLAAGRGEWVLRKHNFQGVTVAIMREMNYLLKKIDT